MTPRLDPKMTAEMQAWVGPTLMALNKAIRAMKSRKVPADEEIFRRTSWARMALLDLQTAIRYAETENSSAGLFD